jgi:Pyridine nucleotide-disulphide oxidoreductase
MRASEVLIIGAGPFGLAISTYLRDQGTDHLIVGRSMDTWRAHMPAGMYLKSEPYGSDMACPQTGYDLDGYSRAERIAGIERGMQFSLEGFLDYCDWYIKHLVPDVSDVRVTEVKAADAGFQVAFADAESFAVKNVVVATGLLPHAYIAAELSGLPAGLVSHTSEHHRFDRFRGRRVAVVGVGSSALETAALLHEAGVEVQLVARRPPVWGTRAVPLNPLTRLRNNKLCEGWKCPLWNSPDLFRMLPRNTRIDRAQTVLGPLGAWWLKDRVEGVIEILHGTRVRGAESSGSGVKLLLDGPGRTSLEVDHVIAGTGFRADVADLDFLPEQLRARIATAGGYPVLSRAGESTVPGLYFAGALGAFSLGPSMRFIAGTHNISAQLTRSMTPRAKG